MTSMNATIPAARPLWALMVPLLMALSTLGGCFFDGQQLEEQRCLNDAACVEKLGPGHVCGNFTDEELGGYCQAIGGSCEENSDCDDGLFCTDEVCDPDDEDANAFGCVIQVRDVDDGIACTIDACDEDNDTVLHDAGQCQCSNANDPRCQLMAEGPCVTGSCNTDTFECEFTPKDNGDTCDDGVACTTGTVCANGQCVVGGGAARAQSDGFCDDGQFCNGSEACDPSDDNADGFGCRPGAPVSDDDAPECADVSCDEDRQQLVITPTNACECVGDADCAQPSVATGCMIFACDGDSFSCDTQTAIGTLDAGEPCDDGFACTRNDTCDLNGQCLGTAVDALCEGGATCAAYDGVGDLDANGCSTQE